jgi:hypothetical protein
MQSGLVIDCGLGNVSIINVIPIATVTNMYGTVPNVCVFNSKVLAIDIGSGRLCHGNIMASIFYLPTGIYFVN